MSGALDAGRLREGHPGRRVEVREEVGSTQDLAFTLAEHGAPDGTVVVAERQTGGRGRLGRRWESPEGAGLWFSMVLRPPAEPPPEPGLLVAATAVAVAEAVEEACGRAPLLRWPNDLLLGERKVGGILLETRDFEPRAPLLVMGIGINCAQGPADFPPGLRTEATSLRIETGAAPDRTALLDGTLRAVDRWRVRLHGGDREDVEAAYRERAAHLGRRVTLLEGSAPRAGVLEDLSPTRGLRLRLDDGTSHTVRPEHARDLRPA